MRSRSCAGLRLQFDPHESPHEWSVEKTTACPVVPDTPPRWRTEPTGQHDCCRDSLVAVVLIGVVVLDVAGVVAAGLLADAVKDNTEVFGL